MKITLLPSAVSTSGENLNQYATTYLINEAVAIDAGVLGFWQTPIEQAAIRHVFLSHSHMDHLASLPSFLENIVGLNEAPVTLHANEAVEHCLRADIFNGRVWPNFLELMTDDGKPFALLNRLENGVSIEVEGLRITPVEVNHVVPTMGFLIEDSKSGVVISSDTGPTEEIWARGAQMANLQAVFLEATFPDEFDPLADLTRHLTPAGFVREMRKLSRPAPFHAVHLKARYREQVAQELQAFGLRNLEIAQFGTTYEF